MEREGRSNELNTEIIIEFVPRFACGPNIKNPVLISESIDVDAYNSDNDIKYDGYGDEI